MAVHDREAWRGEVWREERGDGLHDVPIGSLFQRLSSDATQLIRQEMALAKAEIRGAAKAVGKDAAKMGAAAAVAWMGGLAALAFLILALGDLLDNYWLSSLIVAVVLLATAGIMFKGAREDLATQELKPTETIATLREDATWAKQEAESVKQRVRR